MIELLVCQETNRKGDDMAGVFRDEDCRVQCGDEDVNRGCKNLDGGLLPKRSPVSGKLQWT